MNSRYPSHFHPLLIVYCLSTCLTFSFSLLGPVLIEVGKFTPTHAALVQSLAFLISGILQPKFGSLLDRGKYFVPLFLSTIFVSYGLLTLVFSLESRVGLVIGVVSLLAGMGIVNTSFNRFTVGDVPTSLRAEATAKKQVSVNIAFGVGAICAYFYLKDHSDLLLLGDLVTTLFVIIVLYFIARKRHKTHKVENEVKRNLTLRFVFKNVRGLFGLYLCQIAIMSTMVNMPLIYAQLGLESMKATAISLVTGTVLTLIFMKCIVNYVNHKVKWSLKKQLAVGGLFLGIGSMMIPYCLTTWGVVLSTLVWGIGEMILIPATTVLIYEIFAKNQTGLASGVDTAIKQFALVSTPMIGALVLNAGQLGYAIVFGLAPILPLLILDLGKWSGEKREASLVCDNS